MADYSMIDLHTHTEYSHEHLCDNSVAMVLQNAQNIAECAGKPALVAISDHNTILGCVEAQNLIRSGKYPDVKVINGAEFTVDMREINEVFGGKKVFGNCHILAYGFDETNRDLINFSKKFHSKKTNKLTFTELAEMIDRAGGHLVIAHPGLIKVYPSGLYSYKGEDYKRIFRETAQISRSGKTLLRYLKNSKQILQALYNKMNSLYPGIVVGMERFHPDNYYRGFDRSVEEVCNENGLTQTAGSDFHGLHLHTEFSVGNPFTRYFQEFYKRTLQDCTEFRDGLHISHLPLFGILTNESTNKDNEIRMINAQGESVSYEQYNQVVSALEDEFSRNRQDNVPGRYSAYGESKDSYNYARSKKKKHKKDRKNKYYHTKREEIEENKLKSKYEEYLKGEY